MATRYWRVRLSEIAERDFVAIVQWTAPNYGRRQALVYRRTLIAALTSLHSGSSLPHSAARDEIQPGLRSLLVARRGQRGRRFVLYRSVEVGTVDSVRFLHDTMDLARHLPAGPSALDSSHAISYVAPLRRHRQSPARPTPWSAAESEPMP